jgi:predicted SAM-dependent methyltransferase
MNRRLRSGRFPYSLLLRAFPLHALNVLRYEVSMIIVRGTQRSTDPRFHAGMRLLVNVGCGASGLAGWVNVDGSRAPGVTCVYDCRRRIPLASGCARAIFVEHLVEHLDYDEEAPRFLAECLRVLEPSGVLRVIVPDGEKYLKAYAAGGWKELEAFSPLMRLTDKFCTPMEVVNAHFRQAGQHRFSYDCETLSRLLARSGFENVRKSSFGQSMLPGLAIDNPVRASESLYVEATAGTAHRSDSWMNSDTRLGCAWRAARAVHRRRARPHKMKGAKS